MFLDQTTRNFDALAGQAADKFFSDGTTLSDSIISIATKEKLNPIEIQRLVEKANTVATLKLLQVSTDKKTEFKVADYATVMDEIYPNSDKDSAATLYNASIVDTDDQKKDKGITLDEVDHDTNNTDSADTMKTASMHLPNTRRRDSSHIQLPSVVLVKEASVKEPKLSTKIFKLSKTIEETVQEKLACEMLIQNRAEHVITAFSSFNSPSFSKFANEVYTLHGDTSVPLLKGIAESVTEWPDLVKVAGCIDDTTKTHRLFKEAHESLYSLLNIQKAETQQRAELSELYAEANDLCR